jgi:23S rRNA-/tRNA-specific pseudouridylate synthase
MYSFQEVKKFFITAKENTPLKPLLEMYLPSRHKENVEIIIASGGVWKDKKRIFAPHFLIHSQETVKVHISSFQGKTYILDEKDIVFENQDLMVVYKPPDLNVHAVPSTFFYNLTYAVNRCLEQQGTPFEAAPITRLDRPVEGLVIFPKHKTSERRLFRLVKQRKIQKWYTAALEHQKNHPGPGNPKRLRIRDKISNNGYRTLPDKNGKDADSLFIKTQSLETADIYSVFIFTGRRHQIRFHASHYIAPIIGDWFYGSSYRIGSDDVALVCRGYNIPYERKILRIRLPQHYLDQFYDKINNLII